MYLMRRRKGFFTALFLLSCFIYFNWLLNVSNWSYQANELSQIDNKIEDNSNQLFQKKKKITYYEVYESYENIKVEKSNTDRFILLTADQRLAKITNKEFDEDANNNQLSTDEIKEILRLLYKNEAFLLDLNILKNIKFAETNVEPNLFYGYKYGVKNFLKFDNYSQNKLISFGIFLPAFSNLNKEIISKLNSKCRYIQMNGNYFKEKVLSNLYIEFKMFTIQISIVYERGDFLWIGNDEYKMEQTKYFGDFPRALTAFKLAVIIDENHQEFNVPSDFKKFLFDYDHSKFIECNSFLAKSNFEKLGTKYAQNEKKNKMISPVIEHISNSLEEYYKHYWLAGGTLLGWYRDCGIIPHTQDADLAIWAHEYDDRIKKKFLGNKIVRVWGTLGLLNDSFEFRLYNDKFTFDMFMVYKINLTHQWCGYQINRVKFKRWLPNFDELCSAELLNHKYMIPCDPVKYLDKEYGPSRWLTPESSNYTWKNVVYFNNWTESEWPRTIKYYDKEGKLLVPKILAHVNRHLKYNLTKLPTDDM